MANFVPAFIPNYTSWRRACSSAHRPPPSSARAVAERRVLDAAIGDEGRHVAGRRHVERGVQRGGLGGGDEAAGHTLHLVGGALLDRDASAVGERDVDGGGGRGAVERYAVVQRQHRERISADLVREVAVRGNAVGPHDHEIHLRLAHQRSRRAAGIPCTEIADGAAGSLMRQAKVDLVIVGADRIAANGDFANKIGTYSLAVLALHHGVPFYCAAPSSTIDVALADGTGIPIEQRAPDEVKSVAGRLIAPAEAAALNPAFDVTPARYVTAFITDRGVEHPPFRDGARR